MDILQCPCCGHYIARHGLGGCEASGCPCTVRRSADGMVDLYSGTECRKCHHMLAFHGTRGCLVSNCRCVVCFEVRSAKPTVGPPFRDSDCSSCSHAEGVHLDGRCLTTGCPCGNVTQKIFDHYVLVAATALGYCQTKAEPVSNQIFDLTEKLIAERNRRLAKGQ